MDHLKIFYDQESVRNAVKEYLLSTLDSKVLDDTYAGRDVSGYKEARKTIQEFFSRLTEKYGTKEKHRNQNHAREA
jgi:hypothetical protein